MLRDRSFFPERGGLFFSTRGTFQAAAMHSQTCSVVFIYHARLRNFAREKNVE